MIRTYRESDLPVVMEIWLDTNIKAHSFISKEYWISNYGSGVKSHVLNNASARTLNF